MEFGESGKRSLQRKRPIFLQIAFVLVFLGVCAFLQPVKAQEIIQDNEENVILPKFKGGEEAYQRFILLKMDYPLEARVKGIQGTVLLSFIVEVNGRITNIKIVDSVHPLLDAEAVRVTKSMPKWIPAQHNEKPVRSYFTLPVAFILKN